MILMGWLLEVVEDFELSLRTMRLLFCEFFKNNINHIFHDFIVWQQDSFMYLLVNNK
jgi:hypothetical protein